MGEEKKYKHIFDFFNKKGKWVGGAEPETDSTEIPKLGYSHLMPAFTVYLGWCNIDEACIFCGSCFNDNVVRNSETGELTNVIRKVRSGNGMTIDIPVTSINDKHHPTYEDDCEFLGIEPCEQYLKLKKGREEKFESEWDKVINDKEYFRERYYRERKR